LKERHSSDGERLKKRAFSQIDYQVSDQPEIAEQGELAQLQSNYQQQKVELENIGSTQNQDIGKQNMSTLNLKSELQIKTKELKESELSLFLKQQLVDNLVDNINELTVISDISGSVSLLFNQQAQANVLNKGELIARVTPDGLGKFYCKLNIPEEGLTDVKPGQEVNIKLDAYNHYQYGVLKGKVVNIDKEEFEGMQQFYVLVSVDDYDKEAFRLKDGYRAVSYTHLRAHETVLDIVCRLLLEKKHK